MLSPSHRLTKREDIARVLKRGRAVSTPYIRIYIQARSMPGPTRIACVVGKKVHKSAVKRHRYQRLLRVVAKDYLHKPGSDMVWIGLPSLRHLKSITELRESLGALATHV